MTSKVDRGINARWQRRQEKIAARDAKAFKKAMDSIGARRRKKGDISRFIANALGVSIDVLYTYIERQRVLADLAKIKNEADPLVNQQGGVLVVCITRMEATEGGFIPVYVGLRVAGGGADSRTAMISYNKRTKEPIPIDPGKCTFDNPAGSPLTCRINESYQQICVPTNPTGEPVLERAEMKAAPEGFNLGYAKQISEKILESYENNPGNIGEISAGSINSPIQPRMYLKEDFLFYSREDWQKIFSQ